MLPTPRGAIGLCVGTIVLALLPLLVRSYYVELATTALVAAMLALSLQLLVGCTGLVSLGHGAFYGLAAYAVYLVTPAGAGLSIALACDLRVASASVKITTAFAKVGLSGDYGGTYFLTQMLGSARARELYLMSPVLTAQEALALGMVTKVVPDAEVEAAAHDLAMSLAQGPSVTLGYIKRNLNNAEHMSLEACFDAEAMHHSRCGETADHKEAAKAFVEKRKPVFVGQ